MSLTGVTSNRCRVVVALAADYQSAQTAVPDLRDALADIQDAEDSGDLKRRPKTLALQAKALTLLSSLLHELEHNGVVPNLDKTWESEIGQTARHALKLYEEVATALVDEAEQSEPGTAKATALKATDALLSLAKSALQVGNLAPTQCLADDRYAMVELALDQASTMVLKAKPSSTVELSINNPFLTQIHLLSCQASVCRIQHHFAINGAFDEDEFKAVISDLEVLSDRERSRAKSMRGSKASAASSSAFQSLKQLADTRYSHACLLRQIWRKRKALPVGARRTSTSSVGSSGSDNSSRRNSADPSNKLHPALLATAPRKPSKTGSTRTISFADDIILELDESVDDPKRGSVSSESAQSDEVVVTPVSAGSVPIPASNRTVSWATGPEPMSPRRHDHTLLKRPSFISPFDPEAAFTAVGLQSPGGLPMGRRVSWMPSGDLGAIRARRLSSIGFAKQDSTVSAWNRKASVVSISSDEGSSTSSSALVSSTWNSLSEAIKEYKVSLTILSSSNFSASELAQSKSEVLLAIADSSLFKASLSPRLKVAAEKRTPLLVTAEVYSTWAAREVGWASVIEGTRESEVKDKRTASWTADEQGKIAVLTLLRTWWYRAASSPPKEVDIKNAAKEAADKVTRRLAQREGVTKSLVAKYRYRLLRTDGDLDTSENLFWTSVGKSLRA
ncbi:hypothetical protein QFC22_001933 [Naganishia vaughanmartiniae]|uniref:Uncharacterized protein n=1 Tax=Naganishia vaughanmartiniae TaxID=1424756 RepID=A0ACC2XGI4_9TREE|nr:hypothetical protein QFC22_001933 [Naganishia vaughanmartiniae]